MADIRFENVRKDYQMGELTIPDCHKYGFASMPSELMNSINRMLDKAFNETVQYNVEIKLRTPLAAEQP